MLPELAGSTPAMRTMYQKAKKFCKACQRERPMDLFPLKGEGPYRHEACLIHSPIEECPEGLRDKVLALKDHRDVVKDVFDSPKKKKRAERRKTKRTKKDAFIPVVHERSRKRNRIAKARVAFRPDHMTRAQYAKYLESNHWAEFSREYRENANKLHQCFVCDDEVYELHHHTYARIGHELLADVVPLCPAHHRATHRVVKGGVSLTNAHTYCKMRYQRNELEMRKRTLTTE